jgi:hypothetical protein
MPGSSGAITTPTAIPLAASSFSASTRARGLGVRDSVCRACALVQRRDRAIRVESHSLGEPAHEIDVPGAVVVNDNGEPDYLAYVRDPSNGFISISLPLKGSTEASLRI